MRKTLPFIILLIFFSSCGEEYKVKKAVKKFLSSNMHDPKSYESVWFGDIDTLSWVEAYPELAIQRDDFQATGDSMNFERLEKMKTQYNQEGKKHYKITHKFRGKNSLGATVLNEKQFYTLYIGEKLFVYVQ